MNCGTMRGLVLFWTFVHLGYAKHNHETIQKINPDSCQNVINYNT